VSVILGIDTASPVVGAAVVGPGIERVWSQRVIRGADGVLIPAIAEMLEGVGPIDAVAVSVGPGAFTGLRVGVATALGFAVSLRVNVICISSLEARAALVQAPVILALLDARKGRVYGQSFDTRGPLPVALDVAQDALLSQVIPGGPFVAIGEGADLYRDAILTADGAIELDAARSPAVAVARLGQFRPAVAPNDVALTYLRDADAKKPK
jgi:tRNA threonylcarbamoyladenosine biosynthesis protein TsaB